MMITGLGLLLALVVITTIFMEGWLTGESSAPQGQGAVMALEGWSEDPDFRHAEREARGFLNATTLNSAKPYIFKAEEKEEILEAYYAPLPDPGNYTLELSGRKKLGQRSVYFYQVTSGPDVLPLVVLQEGENFKVHWEFTAGVGDMSWETFVEEKPSEAVLMRALLRPDGAHDAGHPATDWTSWAVEDWKGDYPVRLFTRNNSPEDRRLKSAFKEFGVRRHKQDWVMAQVVIQFQATAHDPNHGIFQSAQVMEVPLASWLPEEFELANTFYSDAERFDGEVKPVRGLMEGL